MCPTSVCWNPSNLPLSIRRAYNHWLAQHSHINSKRARSLRYLHNHLSSTASRIDETLSQVAFLQYVIIISDLSKYVYYLISRFKFSHENFLELFFVIFRVSHMLWLFFFISISASRVTEESNASLRFDRYPI